MSWDFETDPKFRKELDWMDTCGREEVARSIAGERRPHHGSGGVGRTS